MPVFRSTRFHLVLCVHSRCSYLLHLESYQRRRFRSSARRLRWRFRFAVPSKRFVFQTVCASAPSNPVIQSNPYTKLCVAGWIYLRFFQVRGDYIVRGDASEVSVTLSSPQTPQCAHFFRLASSRNRSSLPLLFSVGHLLFERWSCSYHPPFTACAAAACPSPPHPCFRAALQLPLSLFQPRFKWELV